MVASFLATRVAKQFFVAALLWGQTLALAAPTRQIPAKFHWLTAEVAWDGASRKCVTRAQMEIEVPEAGFPVFGLSVAPTQIHWDGNALHPSMLAQVMDEPTLRYLKVNVAAGSRHQLDIEYDAALEKVDAVPVSLRTMAVPFLLRFQAPILPDHELMTNGLALAAGDGKWAVRFQESAQEFYIALPDPSQEGRKGGLGKLLRWFVRLPFALFGGGGEGPPPLITFHRR